MTEQELWQQISVPMVPGDVNDPRYWQQQIATLGAQRYNFNDPNWVNQYYNFLQAANPGLNPDADPARWYNSANNYRDASGNAYGVPVGIHTYGPEMWTKEQIADPYNYFRHDLNSGWTGDYSQFGWDQKGELVQGDNGYVYWKMKPIPAAMQNAIDSQGDRLIDKIAAIAIPALATAGFGYGATTALGAGAGATGGATGGWVSGEALPAGAMWGGADAIGSAFPALYESGSTLLANGAADVAGSLAGTTATTTTAANGLTAKALMAMFPGMSVETANMLGVGSSILSPLASAATSGGGADAIGSAFPALYGSDSTLLANGSTAMNWTDILDFMQAPEGGLSTSNIVGADVPYSSGFVPSGSLYGSGNFTDWLSYFGEVPTGGLTNSNIVGGDVPYSNGYVPAGSQYGSGAFINNPFSLTNYLSKLWNLLKSGGGGPGAGGSGGGLSSGIGDYLNTAASLAPSLAAIAYATGQNPGDTSRLKSLYSQYSPEAGTSQYDLNTDLGRSELTSSLSRRGISGSSFGDQALTNYSTARDLGRNSLLNQGVTTQAGIANNILAGDLANQKVKNDLYSGALLAMSGALTPKDKTTDLLKKLFTS